MYRVPWQNAPNSEQLIWSMRSSITRTSRPFDWFNYHNPWSTVAGQLTWVSKQKNSNTNCRTYERPIGGISQCNQCEHTATSKWMAGCGLTALSTLCITLLALSRVDVFDISESQVSKDFISVSVRRYSCLKWVQLVHSVSVCTAVRNLVAHIRKNE